MGIAASPKRTSGRAGYSATCRLRLSRSTLSHSGPNTPPISAGPHSRRLPSPGRDARISTLVTTEVKSRDVPKSPCRLRTVNRTGFGRDSDHWEPAPLRTAGSPRDSRSPSSASGRRFPRKRSADSSQFRRRSTAAAATPRGPIRSADVALPEPPGRSRPGARQWCGQVGARRPIPVAGSAGCLARGSGFLRRWPVRSSRVGVDGQVLVGWVADWADLAV